MGNISNLTSETECKKVAKVQKAVALNKKLGGDIEIKTKLGVGTMIQV